MSTSDSFGKDELDDLINKAVPSKCSFGTLLITVNSKTKCITEYDKVYIEKQYCDLLVGLWLREVPELIELTKPDDIVNCINSIKLVQNFDDCCQITTKTKSEYNVLVCHFVQISTFLQNQEKRCIARLKKACLDKILQHADFLKCEQSFFEHILQLLKLRPDPYELCHELQLTEILNESGDLGFNKFLTRLQKYKTDDLQVLAIKHFACDLLNLDQYFLLADLKRKLRSYLQETSIAQLVVDGREILEVSGTHIVLSKVITEVENHPSFSRIDEVRFVKADALHIDVDLASSIWHGKNIVIHTNSIIVNKSEDGKIFLWNVSGLDGNARTDIQRLVPHGVKDIGEGGGGVTGEDGNPGESGGNVMIVAENIYNGHFLTIISNGGNGTNGKDGMRGKDGEDGVSISNVEFKNKFPPVSKLSNAEKRIRLKTTYESVKNIGLRSVEDCFVGNIHLDCIPTCLFGDFLDNHINEMGNMYFEVTMENNCKVTFSFCNTGLFTFCQSFLLLNGSPGSEGRSGTKGGEGGSCGFAGDINICTKQNDIVRIKKRSNDGVPGKRGQPGENGKSGKSGHDKAYMDHTNVITGQWPELFLPTKNDSYILEAKYKSTNEGKCVYTPHNNKYVKISQSEKATRKQMTFKKSLTNQKNSWLLNSNTTRKKTICLESIVQRYGSVSSGASSECDFTLDTLKDIIKDIAADVEVEEVVEETSVKRICNAVSRLKSHIFEYRDWFKHKTISTCVETEKKLKKPPVCTDELIKLIEETPTDISLWESLFVAKLDFDTVLQMWNTVDRLVNNQNSDTKSLQVKALLIGKLKLMALENANVKMPIHSQSGQSTTKPPLELCDAFPITSCVSHCETVVQFLCEDTQEMRMNLRDFCEKSDQASFFFESLKTFILEYSQSLKCVKVYDVLKKKLNFDQRKQNQLEAKLQPLKTILTSSKHLLQDNIDELLKKSANGDTNSQICLDKAISSSDDQFLKYFYNVYCTEVRTNFDWSVLEDIMDTLKGLFLSYIERNGPFMKSCRDLIANALSVNILVYAPQSKDKIVLINNHNSKGYKKVYFLLKDSKFSLLHVNNDQLETDMIHNKIILHVDSFTDVKEFIDFHTNSPFMTADYDVHNKSSSLNKEVKNILAQSCDLQAMKQMFSAEENALLLNKWIDKLTLSYLENSSILHFMMLRLKIEGKVISAMELSFVLSFLVKLSLKSANIISKLSWIIASHPQELWLVEITLLTLHHCFEDTITPEIMHEWRSYLNKLDDKSTLMLLLEKLTLERSSGRYDQISTKLIEEILFLSSHVPNSHIGLDDIDLSEWKYSLKDKFWACQLLKVTNWSENDLKSICYSLLLLENLIKMNMCIKIVNAMRAHGNITLRDKITIKDTLRVLCTGEISVNESLIKMLSTSSICRWKNVLMDRQKTGKERQTPQLIKMIKDSRNTSDSVLKFLPDLARMVRFTKTVEEELRENIKTKDDLKEWIKLLITLISKKNEHSGSFLKKIGLVIAKLDSYLLKLSSSIELLIKQSYEDNIKLSVCSSSSPSKSIESLKTEGWEYALVATVFLAIDIVLKIQLRDTQILTILTFLKENANILGQVSTGEGKSIIIVAVTIVNALLNGIQVDIITSSHVLAERDARKYNELYEIFKLSSGHNSDSDVEERKKSYSNCQIMYGELGSFQRDYLLDRFYSKNIMGDREFKLVIVDEVDSMLLDQSGNMLYLSHDIPDLDKLQPLFVAIWKMLNLPEFINHQVPTVQYINEVILFDIFGCISKDNIKNLDSHFTDQQVRSTWEYLVQREFINQNGECLVNKIEDGMFESLPPHACIPEDHLRFLLNKVASRHKEIIIPNHLKDFVKTHLEIWIKSAIRAKAMESNKHYVVDIDRSSSKHDCNPNIVIIDHDTGNDLSNSHWDEGLHQFIQLKHGCKLSLLSLKAVFISNVSYIKLYPKLNGLSGTLGSQSERDLLNDVYGVEYVTIPTANPKIFTEFPPLICSNSQIWLDSIVKEALKILPKRSALIICETVSDVNMLEDKFNKVLPPGSFEQVVSSYKRDYQELRVANNLEPGLIILSTNLAGRGTDIKPSKNLAKAGGLHVCLSFLPSNCRIEEQALGRVARNGVPGTAQLIFKNPVQTCSISLIIDVKKQRDALEDLRILEIKTFYETKIKFEEDSFNEYKKAYDDLRSLMSHHTDDIKSILLKECLDQWAFWLDCNSNHNNSSVKDFLLNLSKIGEKDINTWCLQVKNPSNLLKLGLIFLQKDDLEGANLCFDKVLKMEPDFSGVAHYYKLAAKFKNPSNDDKEEVISELLTVKKQFKDHIHSLLVDINVVENLKICTKGIVQYEFFKEQQENLIKVYMIHIQLIDTIVGGNVDYNLMGYENILIDLAREGILLKFTQGIQNEDNLSFARKYGLDPTKLYVFLKGFSKKKFDFNSIVHNFHMPSRELFWKELLQNTILINETRYVYFDFSRLKQIDPSLGRKLRKLQPPSDHQGMANKDQIWIYQSHELPDSFSKTAYKEDLIMENFGVGRERLKFLEEKDVVVSNKKATLRHDPLEQCTLPFDSICCETFKAIGINPNLANEILDELKLLGILTEKIVSNKVMYSLAINNIKELQDIQLDRFEGYSGDVKKLLKYHFSFRLALIDIFQKLKSGKHLTLHLDINPYKRLESDFINNDVIKSVVCNETYGKKFIKLFSETKDEESWGELFEKVYGKTEIGEITSSLIDIGVFSLSKTVNGKPHYKINKDDKGQIIWPDYISSTIINEENETIKLLLEEYLNKPKEFIREKLEESRGLINHKVPNFSFHLTPLVNHLKQLECPTTEMALLSLNGFDQVLSFGEEKWTWKMKTNVALASLLGIGQIGAAIGITYLTLNPVISDELLSEGISDLVFCAICCTAGTFSWKDYLLNKAISIATSFLGILFNKMLTTKTRENSHSSASKTTTNAPIGVNKEKIIKILCVNAAKSLTIEVACNALPHLIEPQCKLVSTYLVEMFNARIDENLAHHPINNCIDKLCTTLEEKWCQVIIKKKLEETISECRSDSNNILAITVVNVMTALREALSIALQVSKDQDFAEPFLSSCKLAVTLVEIIKSAQEGKFKELYNIPGMLLNRLYEKLLMELTANQSETAASDVNEDQSIKTDVSSRTKDKLQELVKTDLANYLHTSVVFPFITSAGDLIAKSYSKQILHRVGLPSHSKLNRYDYSSQIFENEGLDDSIQLSHEFVEKSVGMEETGKSTIGCKFLELEYDNILMSLFQKNRNLKLFAEIIQKNLEPNENIFRMFCVLIPDVLKIMEIDIPALEIVTYHRGKCEKYTADKGQLSLTTVDIFSDDKIHVQDVLEAMCQTISVIHPSFTWKANDLLEQILSYIENYSTKSCKVKFSCYSNKLELDESLVSPVSKGASDNKSVCLQLGFNIALTRINDHIYKNQSHLRPPFKLSLEQFNILDVTITTPITSEPKTPFHCQPVHYELIMPFAVNDGTYLEDFKISLKLRCNRKHPQPFSPEGPHIAYEIEPIQGPHIAYEIEPIHVNRDTLIIGVKGHILLSEDVEKLEYTSEDCCAAGELILPSNLTISDNLTSLIALVESRKVPWKVNSRRKRKNKQRNKLCR